MSGSQMEVPWMKNFRWYAFWTFDFLKGQPVRNFYNQVKTNYYQGTFSKYTLEKVKQLIDHASKTTEFYKSYSSEISLSQLPVVNKLVYQEKYDLFLSSIFLNSKSNRVRRTSGSTGIPFSVIQNRNKIIHNTAASIFLCTLANYYIGMKQAFIRIWSTWHRKSIFRCFLENVNMIDASQVVGDGINKIVTDIYKKNFKSIISYPSSLLEISQYLNNHPKARQKSKLQSIIAMSEMLSESDRQDLRQTFSCSVRSMYSNEENGIMGIQDNPGMDYYMDTSSYYFEFLKLDSDEPVNEGELGRIVVTDLFNYAFPILRYDTGDLAKHMRIKQNGRVKVRITELYGRHTDTIFDSQGKVINPFEIPLILNMISGIKQWQFIQDGQINYSLLINSISGKINESEVKEKLRIILGEEANMEIHYTDEIPVLDSGKRRRIVNRYLEKKAKGD